MLAVKGRSRFAWGRSMIRRVTDYVSWSPYLGEVENDDGDLVEAWGSPQDVGIFEFSPGGSVEPSAPGMQRVISSPTFWAPYDCPIGPYDKCEFDGVTYTVEGKPAKWKHRRTNREVGTVVNLKVVDG